MDIIQFLTPWVYGSAKPFPPNSARALMILRLNITHALQMLHALQEEYITSTGWRVADFCGLPIIASLGVCYLCLIHSTYVEHVSLCTVPPWSYLLCCC